MGDRDWGLRARAVLSERWMEVAMVLVVVALVGGWVTYTAHVEPGTTTEERVVDSWSRTAGFDHGATITDANPVFEEGERLPNRTVYFTRVAPVVDGNYTFGYAASDDGRLNATVTLELVVRGVSNDFETEGEPLWQTATSIERRSVADLRPGETMRVPFSIDVPAARNRTDDITSELGVGGGADMFVRATVVATPQSDGRTQTFEQNLTIAPEESTYQVTGGGVSRERYEVTESVTVERSYGPIRSIGGPVVLVGSLVALLALGLGQRRGEFDLTDQERRWLAYRTDRAEFDEWIHTVSLPSEAYDLPRARAESLSELVDFAIDVDSGVVEPPEAGVFYVINDGYLYTYTAPLPPDWNEAEVEPSPTTLTDRGEDEQTAVSGDGNTNR